MTNAKRRGQDPDDRRDTGVEDSTRSDADVSGETVSEEDARDVPHVRESTAADTPAAEASGANSEEENAVEQAPDLESVAEADLRSKGEILGELIAAEQKRDEYLDDLRRSHADFENYRRRVMRDGAVQRETGKADVVTPLLEVLDDLDRTRDAAAESTEVDLAKGVELVASKLRRTLEGIGVQRVDEVGVPFDPNIHEAVQQRDADGDVDEPVVAEVLRAGYRLGDRVLRPTMVVVEQ